MGGSPATISQKGQDTAGVGGTGAQTCPASVPQGWAVGWDLYERSPEGSSGWAWLGRGSRYLGHLMAPAVGLAALQQLGRQIAVLPIELLKDKRRGLAQVAPRQGPCRPDWCLVANTETGGQSPLCS